MWVACSELGTSEEVTNILWKCSRVDWDEVSKTRLAIWIHRNLASETLKAMCL